MGENPCGPPSMIPEAPISWLIDGADWTTPSSRMASWYLKLPPLLGEVVAGQLAELTPPLVRLKTNPTAGW